MGLIPLLPIASANISRLWQTTPAWNMTCGWGLGLGTREMSFAAGALRTPMSTWMFPTLVPARPNIGEKGSITGPEVHGTSLWRTWAPPNPSHKMADPSLNCRPLGRPPANSAIPDGRSISELSTPRPAARQISHEHLEFQERVSRECQASGRQPQPICTDFDDQTASHTLSEPAPRVLLERSAGRRFAFA